MGRGAWIALAIAMGILALAAGIGTLRCLFTHKPDSDFHLPIDNRPIVMHQAQSTPSFVALPVEAPLAPPTQPWVWSSPGQEFEAESVPTDFPKPDHLPGETVPNLGMVVPNLGTGTSGTTDSDNTVAVHSHRRALPPPTPPRRLRHRRAPLPGPDRQPATSSRPPTAPPTPAPTAPPTPAPADKRDPSKRPPGRWDPSRRPTAPSSPVVFCAVAMFCAVYVTCTVAGQICRGWGRSQLTRRDTEAKVIRTVFSFGIVAICWTVVVASLLHGNPLPRFPDEPADNSTEPNQDISLPIAGGLTAEDAPDRDDPKKESTAGAIFVLGVFVIACGYIIYATLYLWGIPIWGAEPADVPEGPAAAEAAALAAEGDQAAQQGRLRLLWELTLALLRAGVVLFVILSSPTNPANGEKSWRLGVLKLTVWVLAAASFGGISWYINSMVAHSQLLKVLNSIILDHPSAARYVKKNYTFFLSDTDPMATAAPYFQHAGTNLTVHLAREILSGVLPGANITLDQASFFINEHGASVALLLTISGMTMMCIVCLCCRATRYCSPSYTHNYGRKTRSQESLSETVELASLPPPVPIVQLDVAADAEVEDGAAVGVAMPDQLHPPPPLVPPTPPPMPKLHPTKDKPVAGQNELDLEEITVAGKVSFVDELAASQKQIEILSDALVSISKADFTALRNDYTIQFERAMDMERAMEAMEDEEKGEKEKVDRDDGKGRG